MAIDRVTITGADDSISPAELIPLTREFPFVEWGILASQNNTFGRSPNSEEAVFFTDKDRRGGCNRYPSPRWITDLQSLAETSGELPNLSLHINGIWVRQLLLGSFIVPPELLHCFGRVQLNFHAERTRCNPSAFADALAKLAGKYLIFQLDGEKGNAHLDAAHGMEVGNCYGLFDVSGGAGILPQKWPEPIYLDVQPGESGMGVELWGYHGYAGGLGPENLAEQIPLILKAAAGTQYINEGRIWIDMETRVRSDNDRRFDLSKVRECLEIAAPYVNESSTAA